jgi:hypothetical protein
MNDTGTNAVEVDSTVYPDPAVPHLRLVADPPEPDAGVAVGWLRWLFESAGDGYVVVVAFQGGDVTDRVFAPVDRLDELRPWIEEMAPACDLYFGAATRSRCDFDGKDYGGAEDCLEVVALWNDLDVVGARHAKGAPNELAALEVANGGYWAPSAVNYSGFGLQTWHRLAEVVPASDAGYLLKAMKTTYSRIAKEHGWDVDGSVYNVGRLMRLPGTLNHGVPGDVRLASIHQADWGLAYSEDDLEDKLDAPVVKAPRVPLVADPNSLADAYRAASETHPSWLLLEAEGWRLYRTKANGDRWYTRPGKSSGVSAWWHADGNWVFVFTTSSELDGDKGYSALQLYAALCCDGHIKRASYEVARMLGLPPVDPNAFAREALDGAAQPVAQSVSAAEIAVWLLPENFWTARPLLEHIRQVARARRVPPDALFGALLARVSVATDYRYTLPAIVGAPRPLNLFAAVVAPSGGGKGNAGDVATAIGPRSSDQPPYRWDVQPVGTGQGLVEAFYSLQPDENGKEARVRWWDGMLFTADEGSVVGALKSQASATIVPVLCSMWSGERLGDQYADKLKNRRVMAGTYRAVVLLSLQTAPAGQLIQETGEVGLAQRFLWFAAIDPDTADADEVLDDPGRLPWSSPPMPAVTIEGRTCLDVDPGVVYEVRQDHADRQSGRVISAALDAHRNLNRLKVAALLGILDGRLDVSAEDWALAGMVMDTSDSVRASILQSAATARRHESEMRARTAGRQAVVVEDALSDARAAAVERVALGLIRRAARDGVPVTKRDLRHAVAGKDRQYFEDALDLALEAGWLVLRDDLYMAADET